MIISTIVAVTKNNVIGRDNDIPWYLPADLKYFKKITTGHHILMGRKCYQSIGRPLPNRTNVIITRDPFFISSNCVVCHSIEEGIDQAYANGEEELFIIGGGTIYDQTSHLWNKIYLTEVDLEVEGDVFFPEINSSEWEITDKQKLKADEKNEFDYVFKTLVRKA